MKSVEKIPVFPQWAVGRDFPCSRFRFSDFELCGDSCGNFIFKTFKIFFKGLKLIALDSLVPKHNYKSKTSFKICSRNHQRAFQGAKDQNVFTICRPKTLLSYVFFILFVKKIFTRILKTTSILLPVKNK